MNEDFLKTYEPLLARYMDSQRIGAGFWSASVVASCLNFNITTPERVAALLSQVGHESGWFLTLQENLQYSADGLLKTFPKYFTPELAREYAFQPEKIANRVYANRMGNGNEASGDGWKYRGRGPLQYTGKDNMSVCGCLGKDEYKQHSDLQNKPLLDNPDLLLAPGPGMYWAGYFWAVHNLNAMADQKDVVGITKRINGGLNGLTNRQKIFDSVLAFLQNA